MFVCKSERGKDASRSRTREIVTTFESRAGKRMQFYVMLRSVSKLTRHGMQRSHARLRSPFPLPRHFRRHIRSDKHTRGNSCYEFTVGTFLLSRSSADLTDNIFLVFIPHITRYRKKRISIMPLGLHLSLFLSFSYTVRPVANAFACPAKKRMDSESNRLPQCLHQTTRFVKCMHVRK